MGTLPFRLVACSSALVDSHHDEQLEVITVLKACNFSTRAKSHPPMVYLERWDWFLHAIWFFSGGIGCCCRDCIVSHAKGVGWSTPTAESYAGIAGFTNMSQSIDVELLSSECSGE